MKKIIFLLLILSYVALPQAGKSVLTDKQKSIFGIEYLSRFADLSTAVSSIGSEKTLMIDESETLSADVTIPSNITLEFVNGAILTTNDSLIINGMIVPTLNQIFAGSGSVILSGSNNAFAYPQWWGGVPDAIINIEAASGTITTNNTSAITKAVSSGIPLFLTEGTWGANLHLKDRFINIKGMGKRESILASYSGTDPVLWVHSDITNGQIQGIKIEDIGIYGDDAVVGLQLEALTPYIVSEGTFRNITIGHTTYGIKTVVTGTEIYQNLFENIEIYHSSVDGLYTGLGTYNKYHNIQIINSGQYAINTTDLSSEFMAIQADGQIMSIGQNCVFRNINIESIVATSPPTTYAMSVAGRNSVVDKLNLTNVPPSKCTVGLEVGNDNQNIKNIRSWGTYMPNYLFEAGGGSSGILENLEAGNDTIYNELLESRLDGWLWIDDPRESFLDSLALASDAKLTATLGTELITLQENREFATTVGDWDVNGVAGVTLASVGGQLVATQSGDGDVMASLQSTALTDTLVAGRSYELQFDLIGMTGFTYLNVRVFGVNQQSYYVLADTGTVIYRMNYEAGAAYDRISFFGNCDTGGTFTIDNVSIKPLDKLRLSAYNGFQFYNSSTNELTADISADSTVFDAPKLKYGSFTLPITDGSNGYVIKTDGSGNLTFSPDISTSGSGTFNPDGVTIDTTAGGLARVLPAKVTKWDSVTVKVNIADMDVPANLIQDSLTTKLNRAELDIAPSVIQDSLTAKANTAWFAISPTLIDDSIAVKMNRGEMTSYSTTSHTHIDFFDTLSISWGVLDTTYTGSLTGWKVPNDITITEISAYTDANTCTFNIEERAETTPNSAGTDVIGSDLVADTNQEETGTFTNATIAKNSWLVPVISATGDVSIFTISVRYIKTD